MPSGYETIPGGLTRADPGPRLAPLLRLSERQESFLAAERERRRLPRLDAQDSDVVAIGGHRQLDSRSRGVLARGNGPAGFDV
jgi:hypothetical protein